MKRPDAIKTALFALTKMKFKPKYDAVLFFMMMLFLCASMVQKYTNIISFKALVGVFEPTPKPELSWESFRSTQYQEQLEKHAAENFGFREPVIRLYNQYVWSAYNKTYCLFIVPGKQNYLYYALAVNEHYGTELLKHYPSNEAAMADADKELRMMNKLRHVLKEYGIEFLAFIAPDKTEIYPEYLPRHDADTTTIHLSEYYARRMKETGFPFINMTDWFVSMKDTVSFPLFPKTDSHWRYSAIYGYDSLFRFMNTLEGEAKFPNIHIGPPVAYESEKMEGDEATLNLMFRIKGDKTKYKSEITVDADSTHRKPKVLFVGDSFIMGLETFMPIRELMAEKEIWFYNSTAFVGFDKKTMSVKDINRLSHLINSDYVVFYSAGHQWREATYGFVKDALIQLCVSDSLFEASVTDYANQMRNKAPYSNLTEEELRDEMARMLRNDPEKIPGLDGKDMPTLRNTKGIATARCINEIQQDEDWLLALKMYATQQSIPINDALEQEAFRMIKGEPLLREKTVFDTATFIEMKKVELIEKWRNDPMQTRFLQEKAKKKRRSYEEVLEEDARWFIDKKYENGELFP